MAPNQTVAFINLHATHGDHKELLETSSQLIDWLARDGFAPTRQLVFPATAVHDTGDPTATTAKRQAARAALLAWGQLHDLLAKGRADARLEAARKRLGEG